jgi:hypothetical protein
MNLLHVVSNKHCLYFIFMNLLHVVSNKHLAKEKTKQKNNHITYPILQLSYNVNSLEILW